LVLQSFAPFCFNGSDTILGKFNSNVMISLTLPVIMPLF